MAHSEITGLSLFTGIGGLDLGVERAFARVGYRWRPAAYVERESYACDVLLTRIESGDLPPAPIWTDVATFPGWRFRGLVDIVIGGPPCQAFSEAARGRNRSERDLWGHLVETVFYTQPRWIFAENVDSESSRRRLRGVRRELTRMGYHVAPYLRTSAAEVGAAHDRRRVWLLAHAHSESESPLAVNAEMAGVCGISGLYAGPVDGWGVGSDDGLPARVDRLRALGNAVVPAQAEAAFLELFGHV